MYVALVQTHVVEHFCNTGITWLFAIFNKFWLPKLHWTMLEQFFGKKIANSSDVLEMKSRSEPPTS